MSARHHNRVLRAAAVRATELEAQMVKVLVPLFEHAGEVAARNFSTFAAQHETASAARRATDRALVAALRPADARELARSLALTAAAPAGNSVMVCVKPTPEQAAAIADPDGEAAETLHVTLCYLGEVDGPLDRIVDALKPVGATHAPLAGVVGGYGQFGKPDGGAVGILLPDVPGLVELRVAVTEALVRAGIDYSRDHGFLAHTTVDGDAEPGEASEMLSRYGVRLNFDALYVVRGDTEVLPVPLVGVPAITAAASAAFCLPKELRTKMDPVRLAVIENVGKASVEGAGISFDVTNPFFKRVVEKSGKQITEISKTTQQDVMRAVRASYDAGLSIPDTAKAIQVAMKDVAFTRATMIARTELNGAINGASLAAMQVVDAAADTPDGAYEKEWMTAPGAMFPRHETYADLDGQVAGLHDAFDVGGEALMYPGDPSGEPGETISCRCSMAYVDKSGDEVGDEVESLDASLAPPCEAHVPLEPDDDALWALRAGAWTPPAPEELLSVSCDAGHHEAATVAPPKFAFTRVAKKHLDTDALENDVTGWSNEEAADVAGAAIEEAGEGIGELRVAHDAQGGLAAVANVEEGKDSLIIHNIGSNGGGAGSALLRDIAKDAAAKGHGLRVLATPDAVSFWKGRGFVEETAKGPTHPMYLHPGATKELAGVAAHTPPAPVAEVVAKTHDVSLLPKWAQTPVHELDPVAAKAEAKKLQWDRNRLNQTLKKLPENDPRVPKLQARIHASTARLIDLKAKAAGKTIVEPHAAPPVVHEVVPPPLPKLVSTPEKLPEPDRPFAHYADATVSTQIARSRAAIRELEAKVRDAGNDAALARHRTRLQQLLDEREHRKAGAGQVRKTPQAAAPNASALRAGETIAAAARDAAESAEKAKAFMRVPRITASTTHKDIELERAAAKDKVMRDLAARVKDNPDFRALVRYMEDHRSAYYNGPGGASAEERAVSRIVQTWAGSSNSTVELSQAVQRAALEEFNLSAKSALRRTAKQEWFVQNVDRLYANIGPGLRAVLREMYNHTQEELAAQGITEVTLYRGMSGGTQVMVEATRDAKTVAVKLQPLSSFADNPSVSAGFAGSGVRSAIYATTVPASRIIGTARTGFGCLTEHEWVVLGADKGDTAWVVHRHEFARASRDYWLALSRVRDRVIGEAG